MKLNNCRGNGGHARESGGVQSLVNGITERVGYTADLGVLEDFCAVVGYDRDVPHNDLF